MIRAVFVAILTILIVAAPAAQERPVRRINIPGLITAAGFAPDGKSIVAWDPAGWSTWDIDTGRRTGREPVLAKACGRVATLPRSEDGRTIGVTCDGRLILFDVATTRSVSEWKLGAKQTPILFTATADGSLAAAVIAGATGTVEVSDRSGGKPIAMLTTSDEVEHLAFAPGGKALGTGGISGVRLWSLPDGKETARVDGGSAFAFSPDGQLVAVERSRGAVLADVGSGVVRREAQGPSTVLRFSGDGARLAGLNNQQVVVWDTDTGNQRLVLKGDDFLSAALSPDGLLLATLSRELRGDSTGSAIAIWRVPPRE
jgi:WD40 repeat protein